MKVHRSNVRVLAVVAAGAALASCAASDTSLPANTPTAYGIPSDSGQHGSLYTAVFGAKKHQATSVAASPAAQPSGPDTPAQAAASAPVQAGAAAPAQAAAATPVQAGAIPTAATAATVPADRDDEPEGPPAVPTAYGIPSDSGRQGSLYSYVFGSSRNADKQPDSATSPAPPASAPAAAPK
jgi:hypothetical protein